MNTLDSRAGYAVAAAAEVGLSALAIGVWPDAAGSQPPPVAGFVESSFSPMVVEAAARCLGANQPAHPGAQPQQPSGPLRGNRTAVVIVSGSGDVATAAAVARAVDHNERVGPLLFFASVPNAVAGHVAARWGLTGPVVCLSPAEDAMAHAMALANLLIRDGDADGALIVHVEQANSDSECDSAVAVLVGAGRGDVPRARREDSTNGGTRS